MERARPAGRIVSFEAVARMLRPADPGAPFRIVDAGAAWRLPDMDAPGVTIWGRGPAPSGTAAADAFVHAARREKARLRLARSASWTPWAPPDLGAGAARNGLRRALLAGAIAEIGHGGPRVVDEAAAAAGGPGRGAGYHPGSGGVLIARWGGVLMRTAEAGSPGDPSNGAAALEALASTGDPRVPRIVARGQTSGAAWVAESLLPGTRPRRVTRTLWDGCVELCTRLPRAGSARAADEDLAALAAALPGHAGVVDRIGERMAELTVGLGGAARHGDLWRPNLLATGDALTGVVDWDAWHPAAVPGTDLLNLFATERFGPGLGAAWAAAPWRSSAFRSATRDYWLALGAAPDEREMEGIALAWWAGQAAASLRRLPHLARRREWLDANVEPVMRSL